MLRGFFDFLVLIITGQTGQYDGVNFNDLLLYLDHFLNRESITHNIPPPSSQIFATQPSALSNFSYSSSPHD